MEKEQVLSGLLIQRSSRFLLMDRDTFLTHTGRQAASSACLTAQIGALVLPGHPCPVLVLTHTLLAAQEQNNPGFDSLPLSEPPRHQTQLDKTHVALQLPFKIKIN